MYDEARRKQYAFIRRNWRWLSMMAGCCLLPNVWSLFCGTPFLHGLLLGITSSAAVILPAWQVVLLTGTAPTVMGAEAEIWTAQELDDMRAHGYRVMHHAALRRGDIDHVLVGPGGVFAFETKWRSGDWNREAEAHARRQVEANAEALRLVAKRLGVQTVRPVIVVWGRAAESVAPPLPGRASAPGQTVLLPGKALRQWVLSLPGGVLTQEQIEAVHTLLTQHAGRRDRQEEPAPLSPKQAAKSTLRTLGATYLAFCVAFPISALPPLGDLAVVLAALAAGAAGRRKAGWRVAGTAVLAVETFFLLLVLAELPAALS